GTVLRPDIDGADLLGVSGNGSDGRRLRQATGRKLPAILAHGHAIEAGFDGTARRGLPCQAHVHVGRAIGRHSVLLPGPKAYRRTFISRNGVAARRGGRPRAAVGGTAGGRRRRRGTPARRRRRSGSPRGP